MASYVKFNQFVEDVAHGVHDLSADQLVVALTNTAPSSTYTTLADIAEINYVNCSSRLLTRSASSQTDGTYSYGAADLTIRAANGHVGPFRYVVVYNDTPTSPQDPLICYFDYGAPVTLASGQSLLFTLGDGLFQLG